MKWYLKVLSNYANFNGRARRKEYWMFVLVASVIAISAMVLDIAMGLTFDSSGVLYGPFYSIVMLGHIIPSIAVCVRRLHDVDKPGSMYFIAFIPIVGTIWLLVLMCREGDLGANKYGSNPKEIDE